MSDSITALITNDDGIDSPGLRHLAAAAVHAGLKVIVAAPAEDSSGSSAAITAAEDGGRILLKEHDTAGLEGLSTYAVDAAPALIALMATQNAFGTVPDLVLSGINRGANVGRVILHSGTVGAALTGSINGTRAMAVSLDVPADTEQLHWETASALAGGLIPYLLDQPAGTTLNLNVPAVPLESLPEYRAAGLASFGIVQTTVIQDEDRHFRRSIIEATTAPDASSDVHLLASGYATVTALTSVAEDPVPALPANLPSR